MFVELAQTDRLQSMVPGCLSEELVIKKDSQQDKIVTETQVCKLLHDVVFYLVDCHGKIKSPMICSLQPDLIKEIEQLCSNIHNEIGEGCEYIFKTYAGAIRVRLCEIVYLFNDLTPESTRRRYS